MDILIKVSGIAIVSAITAVIIKKHSPEIGIGLIVCSSAVVLWFALGIIKNIVDFFNKFSEYIKVFDVTFVPLIKIIAVSIISKLTADVCRDSGNAALASCMDLAGCVIAITLSLPLLTGVIELVSSI